MSAVLRPLGNAFLLLFTLDAALTIFSALTGWLSLLSGLVALLAALGCVLVAGLLVLSRRLPLSVFGLPLLFTLWVTLLALPLPLWVPLDRLGLAAGLLQVGVVLAMAARLYRLEGVPWLRVGGVADTATPLRSRQRLGRALVLTVGVPSGSLLYLAGALAYAVSYTTHDFVRLGLRGVSVAHRTYTRQDQEVHLIGMVHIGAPDAYQRLLADIPADRAVVLAEGVTDQEGYLLPEAEGEDEFSYDKVAARLGLTAQGELHTLTRAAIQHADVDISAFAPESRALIHHIGRVLDADSREELVTAYLSFSEALSQTPEYADILFADILDLRNAHLIGELETALETWPVVVIPWGAYHLKDIEPAVERLGFQLSAEEHVTLIPYAALLGRPL